MLPDNSNTNSTSGEGMPRIGVYVCHCGTNIAGAIDVSRLAEYASSLPGVVVSRDYKYMCSDPGQELIKEDMIHIVQNEAFAPIHVHAAG